MYVVPDVAHVADGLFTSVFGTEVAEDRASDSCASGDDDVGDSEDPGDTDGGQLGIALGAAVSTGTPLDCHVATNPCHVTLPSDVNSTNMLPDLAVTAPGTLLPWNDPSTAPLLLVPS